VATLEVLRCRACNTPLVLSDADAIACPSCGAQTPVPESYRDLLRARRDDRALREDAERLLRKLDRPPSMVTKVLARVLDLPMIAFAMLYGIPVGLFAILEADRFNRWLAPRLHVKVDDVPFGYMVAMIFAILLVIAFVPRAFGIFANRRVTARGQLLGALRAHAPAVAGGPSTCRICGAPLAVATDAIVATCTYCSAENAVALETNVVAEAKHVVRNLGTTIREAADHDRAERRATLRLLGKELFRYTFRTVLLAGCFLLGASETPDHQSTKLGVIGIVAFVLLVFIFIFRSGKLASDADERRKGNDVPDWVGYVGPIVMAWLMFKIVAAVAF
jgi:uncharacterized Zn finger protein (UPF0148 family)